MAAWVFFQLSVCPVISFSFKVSISSPFGVKRALMGMTF